VAVTVPVSGGPDPDDPGLDEDDLEDIPGRDRNAGGPILPAYIPTSFKWWKKVKNFFESPAETIKSVFFGTLVTGIAYFLEPLLSAIIFLFAGSKPGVYGGPNEQWGLTDYPVVLADMLGGSLGTTVGSMLEALTNVIGSVVPETPGPLHGVIVTAIIMLVIVAIVRYGPLVLRTVVSGIPFIGSPLATLLERGD
jgi:hypothetical protein